MRNNDNHWDFQAIEMPGATQGRRNNLKTEDVLKMSNRPYTRKIFHLLRQTMSRKEREVKVEELWRVK